MEKDFDKQTQEFADVFRKFVSLTNNMALDEDEIADALADEFLREHRTLQQTSIRIFSGMFKHIAEKQVNCGYDLRNEASYFWIKEVAKIEHTGFPHV